MTEPTVYIVIAGEACAFSRRGEVVTTVTRSGDGFDWSDEATAIADDRGAGGVLGYAALHAALRLAEENAYHCGLDIRRIPDEQEVTA